jgi:hypothetical protein
MAEHFGMATKSKSTGAKKSPKKLKDLKAESSKHARVATCPIPYPPTRSLRHGERAFWV